MPTTTFLTPVDLGGNELRNVRAQNLGAPPDDPDPGLFYFDTSGGLPGVLRWWSGTSWVTASGAEAHVGDGDIDTPQLANGAVTQPKVAEALLEYLLDRANHTGDIDADTLGGQTAAQIIGVSETLVADAINDLIDGAPAALDTLGEIAAALQDDPEVIGGILSAIANKTRRYAVTIGDGEEDEIVVNHPLGSRDVVVDIYQASAPYGQVFASVEHTSINSVTLRFSVPPAADAYRVVIVGRPDPE